MIKIIDFSTIWQDERKENILKTIAYFGRVIKEVGRRTKINTELLYYLGLVDILNLDSINQLKSQKRELESRTQGTFFLLGTGKELKASGALYDKLIKLQDRLAQKVKHKKGEIRGSIANGGTAIRRVVICKGLSSLKKVKGGDILVTSMTRPEFMLAIKKVAAIVTDEGGVTCHAAIVARELNIPAVVGTKVATQILKDGMMVQVKANHGVVKIIE